MSASDKTRQDFDEMDVDGDGYITASELLRTSVENNPKISDDNIAAIVQMADADGDNKNLLRRIRAVREVGSLPRRRRPRL
jgi:Ca2+-binding EF-hand superfamily protein